jgi:outer membrane protein TolC
MEELIHKIPIKELRVRKNRQGTRCLRGLVLFCLFFVHTGCRSPAQYRTDADKVADKIITAKQEEGLGKTEPFSIERPSDILRRRLLTRQHLIVSSEASLGTDQLTPIKHWPEPNYPQATPSMGPSDLVVEPNKPVKLTLIQALEVGARNSPDYQRRKEDVFRTALALDLTRNDFRNIFSTQGQSQLSTDTTATNLTDNVTAGVTRSLKNGADMSAAMAVNLVNLLTQGGAQTLGLSGDASISIPLLRGSGEYIAAEPLTQAERNVIYQLWDFERYKRTFAVNVAQGYFNVLRQMDGVTNAEEDYRSSITSARWSRRWADAGRIREIDVDQAVQRELSARNGWIVAQEQYQNSLDSFKDTLGLPTDARIEVDANELVQLRHRSEKVLEEIRASSQQEAPETVPPANAPVELEPPNYKDAGPLEIGEPRAVKLAFVNRLDLKVANGEVYDAQRQVVVKADALRAGLTLGGTAHVSDTDADGHLNFDRGNYAALLTLDLPIERTRERNDYRNSLIDLERATRNVQTLEDQIKLSIRSELRTLLETRESLKIQAQAVVVAEKRVRSSRLFLEAGRAQIRDLLDAQDSLLSAQNSLTRALVDYRIGELEIQRDLGLIEVNERGLWHEFTPEAVKNGKQ